MSDQRMTVEEIKKQFPDEWVLLDEPEIGESQRVVSGELLFHSPNRDELYQKAMELRPKHSAVFFTGKIPKGTAILL
jgi:hypothetical protein